MSYYTKKKATRDSVGKYMEKNYEAEDQWGSYIRYSQKDEITEDIMNTFHNIYTYIEETDGVLKFNVRNMGNNHNFYSVRVVENE
ncbi:MAG: hypothetical protein Q4F31_09560 [Eubacteriales bacterium]|nr:hypothetical protein [Eubacteriales bacterium]